VARRASRVPDEVQPPRRGAVLEDGAEDGMVVVHPGRILEVQREAPAGGLEAVVGGMEAVRAALRLGELLGGALHGADAEVGGKPLLRHQLRPVPHDDQRGERAGSGVDRARSGGPRCAAGPPRARRQEARRRIEGKGGGAWEIRGPSVS
jgi:hypothetical protein